jgi:hypothetical protein
MHRHHSGDFWDHATSKNGLACFKKRTKEFKNAKLAEMVQKPRIRVKDANF